jgi:hypothetical protein
VVHGLCVGHAPSGWTSSVRHGDDEAVEGSSSQWRWGPVDGGGALGTPVTLERNGVGKVKSSRGGKR